MATVIVGAGCVTSLGLGAASTAAGLGQGRRCVERRPPHADVERSCVDDALLPGVPDAALPARAIRLLRLALAAIEPALSPCPKARRALVVLLGLPEPMAAVPAVDPAAFLRELVRCGALGVDAANSVAVARGRATGLMALQRARHLIEQRQLPFVLVGSLDSWVDDEVVAALRSAGRVRVGRSGPGFTPGEAAGFVLLTSAALAQQLGLAPLAEILATGVGAEPGHLATGLPCLGEGMTLAFERLFAAAPAVAPIATHYTSLNGERDGLRELGAARTRHGARFAAAPRLVCPAFSLGDTGAASSGVLLCAAAHELAGRAAPGAAAAPPTGRLALLVSAASDGPDRAAALLAPFSHE